MKNAGTILDYLIKGKIDYLFGIPAGSVNAIFDELYDRPEITPIVAKHEGAAAFMASAYAKYSGKLGVCIGCSGPGAMNLVSGAANAMREQIPLLILTGSVPLSTQGKNASQELNAQPVFSTVTKYSQMITRGDQIIYELEKAIKIAFDGVPGPVHLSLPIDIQLQPASDAPLPEFPTRLVAAASDASIDLLYQNLISAKKGVLFVGNGARQSVNQVVALAEKLGWPFVTTPQAKGLIPRSHPLHHGIYGFAGHNDATQLVHEGDHDIIFVIGSSLGETATSNYQANLTEGRKVIQLDHDQTVFNRTYEVDQMVLGDIGKTVSELVDKITSNKAIKPYEEEISLQDEQEKQEPTEFDTKTVLPLLQLMLPLHTKYTVDIGEFMSYVVHYMDVYSPQSFDINVHYGSMGTGIGSSIGLAVAQPKEEVACITGDGCFFMHGMEILTAKEHDLPITFIVINNSRLGMVHHGHKLQYKRVHSAFSQIPISIASLANEMGIPAMTISSLDDLHPEKIKDFTEQLGPKLIEIQLIDDAVPPMGDRVKFLSSFAK